MERYVAAARELDAAWARAGPAHYVVTAPWVRFKCRFGCGCYDARRLCPPRTPTPAETAAVVKCYDRALLAAWESPPGEKPRRAARGRMHKAILELERRIFLDGHPKALGFAAGPCNLCEECDVAAPCRRPGEPRPAMEACGIDVFTTMANAGFKLEVRRCEEEGHYQCGLVLVD
jgi:predicted metal-binding protein